MSTTVYTSEHNFGGYKKYRGVLTYSTSSTTGNAKTTVSWTIKVQMVYGWLWGVGIKISGADSGSATGYLKSSPGSTWTTVASKSGSFTVSGAKSSQSKSLTFTAYGATVSGYGSAGGSVSKTASVSIPALKTYTITYNANGGSGAPGKQTKYHGIGLTISSTKPTRTGYDFKGWSLTKGGSVYYTPGSTCGKNENLTLYAVWQLKTYKITFDNDGGSNGPEYQTKTYDVDLAITSKVPTKSGYLFDHWRNETREVNYNPGTICTYNGAQTLKAIYVPASYTITYDANGGSGAPGKQTKEYNKSINLSKNIPTKQYYDFVGWGTSKTSTTAAYKAGDPYTINANLSLFAIWKKQSATCYFYTLNGTLTRQLELDTYYTISGFSTNVNSRYGFLGWKKTSPVKTDAKYTDTAAGLGLIQNGQVKITSPSVTNFYAVYRDITPSKFSIIGSGGIIAVDGTATTLNDYINGIENSKSIEDLKSSESNTIIGYFEFAYSGGAVNLSEITINSITLTGIFNTDTYSFTTKKNGNKIYFVLTITGDPVTDSDIYTISIKCKDTLSKEINGSFSIKPIERIIDIYRTANGYNVVHNYIDSKGIVQFPIFPPASGANAYGGINFQYTGKTTSGHPIYSPGWPDIFRRNVDDDGSTSKDKANDLVIGFPGWMNGKGTGQYANLPSSRTVLYGNKLVLNTVNGIYVDDHSTPIGTMYTQNQDISIPGGSSSQNIAVASINNSTRSFGAGCWIFSCSVRATSTSSGSATLFSLATSSSSTGSPNTGIDSSTAVIRNNTSATANQYLQISIPINLDYTFWVVLRGYSTTAVNGVWRWRMMRIS